MLRNYLAAALRNLARNRLYAGVTIAGLAIGFAAAMLIALFVRDEYSYDRFIPEHERVYRASETLVSPGAPVNETDFTPMMLAPAMKLEFNEIALTARLSPTYFPPTVRRGDITAGEQKMFWADPDFFRVIPLPAIAGDLATSLEAPDAIVLTRSMARKYFGRDTPVGETLLVDKRPMKVTAVLEDLPSNTHLSADFFLSGGSPDSTFSHYEEINGPLNNTLATYFKLKPGASVETMRPRLADFLERRLPIGPADLMAGRVDRTLHLVPLADIHMRASTQGAFKPASDPAIVGAIGAVGALIVLVAAINFVTLMTARASRRAVEVGVRKAAGATRRDLVVQFMGEALVYVLVAAVLAVALAELLLPAFNAYLQRTISFDYLTDPLLAATILGAMLATALAAGVYPALVLSSFRPSAVLKGGPAPAAGGGGVRQGLVVVQFAVLIGLVLVATTISRQTLFAINEGMRLDKDQVLLVFSSPCNETLRDQLRALPGIRGAACTSAPALNLSDNRDSVIVDGRRGEVARAEVDFGFFEVFGLKPVAGRFFERSRSADGAMFAPDALQPVVLNETAVRRLGFASPQAAVGRSVLWHGFWDEGMPVSGPENPPPAKPSVIVGVAPDFTFGSMRGPIDPTLFAIGRARPPMSIGLAAKLEGDRIPETLAEIDRIWKRVGDGQPMLQMFADRFTLRLYIDTIIQGVTIALSAIIALSIAALGLFALSAYTAERRTKEIGVRKAMGASSGDILKLLLWQFTKPVLWANLIAWPVGFFLMDWWLKGFAYHVELNLWTFVGAGAGALAIAWATVFVHALKVSRAKPVGALRYE